MTGNLKFEGICEVIYPFVQGLFVPFARVGSGDPVRVLRLFHNEYTGFNWSIYCWDYVQLVATDANVLLLKSGDSETSNWDGCWFNWEQVTESEPRTVLYSALNSYSCRR